jgi:RNA polymerase sigma factor (sigma-70 family)
MEKDTFNRGDAHEFGLPLEEVHYEEAFPAAAGFPAQAEESPQPVATEVSPLPDHTDVLHAVPDEAPPVRQQASESRQPEKSGAPVRSNAEALVNEISSQYPLLDEHQEKDLARRIERGDPVAKETLVNSNVRLAYSIAKGFQRYGHIDELFMEAVQGLMRAAEKFDPNKGFRFSTYATWWIRQAVQRGAPRLNRTIYLPHNVFRDVSKVEAAISRLEVKLSRVPTPSEIAEATNLTEDEVVDTQEIIRTTDTSTSLDKPVGEDNDTTLGNLIATGTDTTFDRVLESAREQARNAFVQGGDLSELERLVITHRFGLGGTEEKTRVETAKVTGVSLYQVKQLEKRAIVKLQSQGPDILRLLDDAA